MLLLLLYGVRDGGCRGVDAAEQRLVEADDCGQNDDRGDRSTGEGLRADEAAVERTTDSDVSLDGEENDQPDGHETERIGGEEKGLTDAVRVYDLDAVGARPQGQAAVEPIQEDERHKDQAVRH